MSDTLPTLPPPEIIDAVLRVTTWAKTQALGDHWEIAGFTPSERVRQVEAKLALKAAQLVEAANLYEIAVDAYRHEKARREMLETLLTGRAQAATPGDDAIATGGGE